MTHTQGPGTGNHGTGAVTPEPPPDVIYITSAANIPAMRALHYDSARYAPVVAFQGKLAHAQWRRNVSQLAPDGDNLLAYQQGKMTWTEYVRLYVEKLTVLDAAEVVAGLRAKYGPNPLLMCHCLSPVQCHRTVLALWLTQNGFQVREWQHPKKAAAPTPAHPSPNPREHQ